MQGAITEYPVEGNLGIAWIAAAPSGDTLWFTENDSSDVGSITTNGVVGSERLTTSDYPFGITAGPDGNMWYCAGFGNAIGRVNLEPPPPPPPPPPPLPPPPPPPVKAPCHVPHLIGQLLTKAKANVRRAHCRVGKVTRKHAAKSKRNHVIAQSPRPGRRLAHGARVNLTVGK
jgi:hypothetical protein